MSTLTGKLDELLGEAQRYRLDILGLSSTKKQGQGAEELRMGWKLFYSGADSSVHAQAGVGILTSPRLTDRVVEWTPISSRVAVLRLRLLEGRKLAIVQGYAPNLTSEYPTFLNEVEQGVATLHRTDSLMLMGDFNAHVGNDTMTWGSVIGKNGDAHLNHNGELLLDFCAGNALTVMNTVFQHKDIHKYTWYRDALGQKSMIDFIMASPDLKKQVLDVRVKRGAELSTDHHLVVASLRCQGRLPLPRRGKDITRVKWEALENQAAKERLAAIVAEKAQDLPPVVADVETEWGLLKSALLEAAANVCGLTRIRIPRDGRKLTSWWSPQVKQAIQAKKACFHQWLANKSPLARQRYEEAKKEANKVVAAAKASTWNKLGEKLSADYHQANKVFWKTMKRLRNPNGGSLQTIKDKDGRILIDGEAIVDRWKEHFEELLNPTSVSPLSPLTNPVLHFRSRSSLHPDEVWNAVRRLKSGKAAGVDEIRPELLKSLDGSGIEWLARVFQAAWDSGEVPLDWRTGVVVPVYKKGDKMECSNYRGISLLSLPGKIYAKVLESKVRAIVEPRMADEQCGFRPGRSVTDQVFTLKQIQEKAWEYAKDVFIAFIDLEKAYDRVPRDKLWECLQEYEVDGELLRAIQSLYKECTSRVRVGSIKSTPFTVDVGLRQGCVLSPILFATFMDRIEKRSRGNEGVRIGNVKVSRLLFADDLALLASSQTDLQRALERFAAECAQDGMKISTAKTEAMCLSRRPVDCALHVSGVPIRQVEEFKYLGTLFTSDGRQEKELSRRINCASGVLRELWTLAGNRTVSTEALVSIFKAVYRSSLTYGHETWILTERTRSRVQAAEMRFLRRIVGVTRMDRIRNTSIREALDLEPLLLFTEKSQLRWFGHVLRMGPDRLARQVFQATPDGRRPVGRPRNRWMDQADALLQRAGHDPDDAETLAADRHRWKAITTCLPPRPEIFRRRRA